MHLPADHHENQQVKLPGVGTVPSTGLKDSAVFDAEQFAAYRNAVQTAKLLLLDGDGLNAALGDILKAKGTIKGGVATYPANGNLMTTQLYGYLPWLRSIDSDHSWRSDGRPRFCATEDAGCPSDGAQARPEEHDAGNDTFPLWESCLLRPDVRDALPRLGERHRAVPRPRRRAQRRPERPGRAGRLAAARRHDVHQRRHDLRRRQPPVHGQGGRRRLRRQPGRRAVPLHQGGQHPRRLEGRRRRTGRSRSRRTPATAPTRCSCARPIRATRSTRPTSWTAGAPVTRTVVLDTTPPQITITKPAPEGVTFDSDDFSAIEYTVTDAASGVDARDRQGDCSTGPRPRTGRCWTCSCSRRARTR